MHVKNSADKKVMFLDNVRVNWFLSYGLVLLIPMIVSLLIFHSNINLIERQSETAGLAVLRSASAEFETWERSCYAILNKITNNSEIYRNLENINNPYSKIMISDYLETYKEFSNSVKSVVIYEPENKLVISSETSSDAELYYQTLSSDGYRGTFEQWEELYSIHYPGGGVLKRFVWQTWDSFFIYLR